MIIQSKQAIIALVALLSFTNIAFFGPSTKTRRQEEEQSLFQWHTKQQKQATTLQNDQDEDFINHVFEASDLVPPRPASDYLKDHEHGGLQPKDSFGACLKIMDDNHWLVEWLAYHWFVLPLRHLVVYVDPRSKTSPQPILDRWTNSGLLQIHVVTKLYQGAIPFNGNPNIPGILEHRGPHSMFIQDCMKIYKQQTAWNASRIVIIDTDEFIAINNMTRHDVYVNTSAYRGPGATVTSSNVIPRNSEPGSVMRLLQQEERRLARNQVELAFPYCHRVHRVQMCKEEDNENATSSSSVDTSFALPHDVMLSSSDFLTLRRQYGEQGRQVKNMVHLRGISNQYLAELNLLQDGNVHNPVPGHCRKLPSSAWEKGPYLPREDSLLTVYHYSGNKAQREFRSDTDARGSFGHRTGTPQAETCPYIPADDVMPWLQGFVDLVGPDEAGRLLEGVGRVDGWPDSQKTLRLKEHVEKYGKSMRKIGPTTTTTSSENEITNTTTAARRRCAISFYGLPRAFQSLVLPSIVENVIKPNALYMCDYFIHYYHQTNESAGRSGAGGVMNPYEVLLVRQQVKKAAAALNQSTTLQTVTIRKEEEAEFWKKRALVIDRVRTKKDAKGRYLYFPWSERSYVYPDSTDNILKMWHATQEAWQMISDHARSNGFFEYDRVAMLRVDAVYMTPIDIFDAGVAGTKDVDNTVAVIPGFGRHPVSDRMIYGPARAVKVWAAERFDRMEGHVKWMAKAHPGYGLHSERFVQNALFPTITTLGVRIVEHDTLCFFRARADESVWITDCGGSVQIEGVHLPSIWENLGSDVKGRVEAVIGRSCGNTTQNKALHYKSLDCSSGRRRRQRG